MTLYLLIYLLTPPWIPLPLPEKGDVYELASFAYHMDIVGENEIPSFFYNTGNSWEGNVRWTRSAISKLRYTPSSFDRHCFPCEEICLQQILAIDEYRKCIDNAFWLNYENR